MRRQRISTTVSLALVIALLLSPSVPLISAQQESEHESETTELAYAESLPRMLDTLNGLEPDIAVAFPPSDEPVEAGDEPAEIPTANAIEPDDSEGLAWTPELWGGETALLEVISDGDLDDNETVEAVAENGDERLVAAAPVDQGGPFVLSPNSGPPGATVTATVTGSPGSRVTITDPRNQTVASGTVAQNRQFSVRLQIPQNAAAGQYTFMATVAPQGAGLGAFYPASFTVTRPTTQQTTTTTTTRPATQQTTTTRTTTTNTATPAQSQWTGTVRITADGSSSGVWVRVGQGVRLRVTTDRPVTAPFGIVIVRDTGEIRNDPGRCESSTTCEEDRDSNEPDVRRYYGAVINTRVVGNRAPNNINEPGVRVLQRSSNTVEVRWQATPTTTNVTTTTTTSVRTTSPTNTTTTAVRTTSATTTTTTTRTTTQAPTSTTTRAATTQAPTTTTQATTTRITTPVTTTTHTATVPTTTQGSTTTTIAATTQSPRVSNVRGSLLEATVLRMDWNYSGPPVSTFFYERHEEDMRGGLTAFLPTDSGQPTLTLRNLKPSTEYVITICTLPAGGSCASTTIRTSAQTNTVTPTLVEETPTAPLTVLQLNRNTRTLEKSCYGVILTVQSNVDYPVTTTISLDEQTSYWQKAGQAVFYEADRRVDTATWRPPDKRYFCDELGHRIKSSESEAGTRLSKTVTIPPKTAQTVVFYISHDWNWLGDEDPDKDLRNGFGASLEIIERTLPEAAELASKLNRALTIAEMVKLLADSTHFSPTAFYRYQFDVRQHQGIELADNVRAEEVGQDGTITQTTELFVNPAKLEALGKHFTMLGTGLACGVFGTATFVLTWAGAGCALVMFGGSYWSGAFAADPVPDYTTIVSATPIDVPELGEMPSGTGRDCMASIIEVMSQLRASKEAVIRANAAQDEGDRMWYERQLASAREFMIAASSHELQVTECFSVTGSSDVPPSLHISVLREFGFSTSELNALSDIAKQADSFEARFSVADIFSDYRQLAAGLAPVDSQPATPLTAPAQVPQQPVRAPAQIPQSR